MVDGLCPHGVGTRRNYCVECHPVKTPAPTIGRHLASLNLFREADGKLYITVAGATGAMFELREIADRNPDKAYRTSDYVDGLIVEAALDMVARGKGANNGRD
jgi:hypothetical protein